MELVGLSLSWIGEGRGFLVYAIHFFFFFFFLHHSMQAKPVVKPISVLRRESNIEKKGQWVNTGAQSIFVKFDMEKKKEREKMARPTSYKSPFQAEKPFAQRPSPP